MTTYIASTLVNGQTIAFDPNTDILSFDGAFVSAGGFRFIEATDGANIKFNYSGRTIFLTPTVDIRQLTTTNVVFANGSLLLVGDNSTGTTGDALQNTLNGSSKDDLFLGLAGNDIINAGAGNDRIIMAPVGFNKDGGFDTVDGGAGFDRVSYDGDVAVNVDLQTGLVYKSTGGIDHLLNIEGVIGSSQADNFLGGNPNLPITGAGLTDPASEFEGMAGNDTIDGGSTDNGFAGIVSYRSSPTGVVVDLALGTASDGFGFTDTLFNLAAVTGSEFADVMRSGGRNRALTDTLFESFEGRGGNDLLIGRGGVDNSFNRAEYGSSPGAVNVNLATGIALDGFGGTDTLIGMNAVRGSNAADTLIGGAISGPLEIFTGNNGNDSIDGGAGEDRADYTNSIAGVNVHLGNHTASDGFGGTDTLLNIEQIRGSDFNDILTGDDGNNLIIGGFGDDTMDGGAGNDTVSFANQTAVTVNLGLAGPQNTGVGTDTITNFENLAGSSFNDFLAGNGGNNRVDGRAGNDTMFGLDGNDTYVVDAIGDVVNEDPSEGNDTVETTLSSYALGNDVENITYVGELAFTGTGNALGNTLTGGRLGDTLGGGDGNDSLVGGLGTDSLTGGLGDDTLRGGDQNDSLAGGDGNDQLFGGKGTDTLDGGIGNDTVAGLTGNDVLTGGDGTDTADYSGSSDAVTVSLAIAGAQLTSFYSGTDTLSGFENLTGSNFNDALTGDGNANELQGGSGNDTLLGGAGADTLNGGGGYDGISYEFASGPVTISTVAGTVIAPDGTDTIISIERFRGSGFADTFTGGNPSHIYRGLASDPNEYVEGMAGNDTINGGSSAIDRFAGVSYAHSIAAVNVNLGTGTASDGFGDTDTLTDIDGVIGSDFNDTLTGGSNSAQGNVANLFEQFEGGLGDDTIDGGSGGDRVIYSNASGSVTVRLDLGTATGADGSDTLISISQVRGSAFADVITGAADDNNLEGMGGNDTIDGGTGFDAALYTRSEAAINATFTGIGTATVLDGWGAVDTLTNIDIVIGSDFNDTLTGGAGNDQFQGMGGNDTIDGGAGFDLVGYAFTRVTNGVGASVNLATGIALDPWGGTDTLINIEGAFGSALNDSLVGNASANTLNGMAGDDTIDGGNGLDTATYQSAIAGVTVSLATNTSFGADGVDTLISMENIRGSNFADTLTGDGNNNVLEGLGGNDAITGGAGADTAGYAPSTDGVVVDLNITIGQVVSVSQGTDTLSGIENLVGSNFNDSLTGDAASNSFTGNFGNDTMLGGDGFDTLNGGDGNDSLSGMNQGDIINGGNGNDWLGGGKGLDSIDGGADNDTLQGGLGTDNLTGGSGIDAFIFSSALDGTINIDTITDFVSGTDLIQLSALTFGAFAGLVGQTVGLASLSANLAYNATTGALSYDADGAGAGPALNFAILGTSVHPAALGNDFMIIA